MPLYFVVLGSEQYEKYGSAFLGSEHCSGWASRIDARLKLVALGSLVVALSATLSAGPYLLLSIAIGGWLLSLKPGKHLLLRWMKPVALLLLITFLLHLLFAHKHGPVLVTLLGVEITKTALVKGGYFCWRLLLFFLVGLCFLLSISPDQFSQAIWRGLAPLKRLGVPADDLGLVFFLVIRFIPEIFRQYRQIKMSQLARGARFGGRLPSRIRRLVPLLIPVTVAALRRSDTLTDCLTVRGWGVTPRRSYYGWGALHVGDLLFALLLLTLIIVLVSL